MIDVQVVNRDQFYSTIKGITFREGDEQEARDFGCLSVEDCLKKSLHPFNRYYIVYEDGEPKVAIILKRCGEIAFFIASNIRHKVRMVKKLKKLARTVVNRCGIITTKTALNYTEAQKMNKLIGFKPFKLYNKYGIYYLGDIYGWKD